LILSCKTDRKEQANILVLTQKNETTKLGISKDITIVKTNPLIENQPYMNAYIVVVDTSQNYDKLRRNMYKISKLLRVKIDTLERGYDKKNNFIGLVKSIDGEIYYDNYFPRRHNSTAFLSLEYLNFYTNSENENDKTIALISYITDKMKDAEKQLKIIQQHLPNAYLLNTKLYMGCMN